MKTNHRSAPRSENRKNILAHRWYLYLTEFFAGMSVMAVELGASRLLAPFFSSSQIVWTIIIGTIMIAMALGNVMGGRWADRDRNPSRLFFRILIAAVWIGLIPLAGKYLIAAVTGILVIAVNTNLLIWAAFLTCMVLFVFPLFLLGTVTPSLIRFGVSDLDESGRVAGRLGACNTIGSIIGTFLPTFVTIPAVGTAVTFLIFSGILLALSAVYFFVNGGGKRCLSICCALFIVSGIFGHTSNFAFWENHLTYEGESIYNYLQVKDLPDRRILSTNVLFGVQSVAMKQPGLTGLYYDYALAAPVMAGRKDPDILVLGMGTGTFATSCRRYFPQASISGVEIDQKITHLARRYFHLPSSIPVTAYDGRAYLNADSCTYDVIMVDAYQDITIPFQMSSREFFTSVRNHLKKNGVMIVNMNMHGTDAGKKSDDITAYLTDTIASVFPDCVTVDVADTTNRELFAGTGSPGTLSRSLRQNISSQTADTDLTELLRKEAPRLTAVQAGDRILTDDRAPVELIGMRTIDTLIQEELRTYKKIYREKGLRGLLADL